MSLKTKQAEALKQTNTIALDKYMSLLGSGVLGGWSKPPTWGDIFGGLKLPPLKVTTKAVTHVLTDLAYDPLHIWVAGSAAIAPDQAEDVDVWILDGGPKNSPLCGNPLHKWVLKDTQHFPTGQTDPNYPLHHVHTRQDWTMDGVKVQMVWTTCETVEELLDTFDLSVHAHAINSLGQTVAHPKATLPGKPILFLNPPGSDFSHDRLAQFALRYEKAGFGPATVGEKVEEGGGGVSSFIPEKMCCGQPVCVKCGQCYMSHPGMLHESPLACPTYHAP